MDDIGDVIAGASAGSLILLVLFVMTNFYACGPSPTETCEMQQTHYEVLRVGDLYVTDELQGAMNKFGTGNCELLRVTEIGENSLPLSTPVGVLTLERWVCRGCL